jgi:hypothetical protein
MTIELRCAEVAPDNSALIDEICSRGPRTMSWSNCIDYTFYDDFHRMAQAFDATRHYGYSMNWPAMVFGADLSDYAVDSDPSYTNLLLTESLRKKEHAILTRPCFGTPINSVGYTLPHKMKRYWVDYFTRGKAKITANLIKNHLHEVDVWFELTRVLSRSGGSVGWVPATTLDLGHSTQLLGRLISARFLVFSGAPAEFDTILLNRKCVLQ